MKKGFTLIELMVSVAIFTVVMVIALGALLSISSADRKAETLKSVIDNLNFALDSMSRAVRTGTYYDCNPTLPISGPPTATDCSSGTGAQSIAFYTSDGKTTVYCLGAGTSCSSSGTSVLRSQDGGNTFSAITAAEVVVDNLTFYVKGAPQGDSLQPRVTITLGGHVQVTSGTVTQVTPYVLQTTITQRVYDQ